MPHARKQIRDALKVKLTGLTTTDANVFLQRIHPVDSGDFPALLIYFGSEPVEANSQGRPIELLRKPTFVIEGVAQDSDAEVLEDTLDLIAAEVEVAIGDDPELNGLVLDGVLEQTDSDVDATGNKPTGRIGLAFRFEYRTNEDDPETII